MPDMVLGGRLLVANPRLADLNFDRTVVLILVHNDEGALGVVLNRPSETSVGVPLPAWEPLAAAPAVIFVGGPVNHEAALCLARIARGGDGGATGDAAAGTDGGATRDSWTPVTGDVGTVDLDAAPDRIRSDFGALRIFAGYAGWSRGQLEGEIEAGAWWVLDADGADVFSDDPDGLWKRVLRRQRGDLALVAAYPADPTMN